MGHRGPGEPADRHARSCSQRRPGRVAARAQKRRTRCTGPSEGGGRAISVRAGRFAGRAGGRAGARAGAHMLVVVACSSGRDPSCLRLDGDSDLLIRASPTMAAGARTRARTRTCGCRPPAARTRRHAGSGRARARLHRRGGTGRELSLQGACRGPHWQAAAAGPRLNPGVGGSGRGGKGRESPMPALPAGLRELGPKAPHSGAICVRKRVYTRGHIRVQADVAGGVQAGGGGGRQVGGLEAE